MIKAVGQPHINGFAAANSLLIKFLSMRYIRENLFRCL